MKSARAGYLAACENLFCLVSKFSKSEVSFSDPDAVISENDFASPKAFTQAMGCFSLKTDAPLLVVIICDTSSWMRWNKLGLIR